MLGDLALESGNIERAMTEYTRALELKPGSRTIAMKLAYIQWDLLNLRDEAVATLKDILRHDPGNTEAARKLKQVEQGKPVSESVLPTPKTPG